MSRHVGVNREYAKFGPVRWSAPNHLKLNPINADTLALLVNEGPQDIESIASYYGYRVRDWRRRNLPRLTSLGLVEVDGGVVSLVPDWERVLEQLKESDLA